jgi:hypothetical protein
MEVVVVKKEEESLEWESWTFPYQSWRRTPSTLRDG